MPAALSKYTMERKRRSIKLGLSDNRIFVSAPNQVIVVISEPESDLARYSCIDTTSLTSASRTSPNNVELRSTLTRQLPPLMMAGKKIGKNYERTLQHGDIKTLIERDCMEYSDYFKRAYPLPQNFKADEQIGGASSTEGDDPWMRKLFTACFDHHVRNGEQRIISELEIDTGDSQRRFKVDHLTPYFLRKIYGPSLVGNSFATEHQSDDAQSNGHGSAAKNETQILKHETNECIDFDEFFHDITDSADREIVKLEGRGTNRFSYIIGEIGQGKSLLRTYIADLIRVRSYSDPRISDRFS